MSPSEPKTILYVDLEREQYESHPIPDEIVLEFPAGVALATHLLGTHLPAGTDPLGPKSVIVLSAGLLAGLPYPGATRLAVAAKSPLTGCWTGGTMGGEFAWALCRSGWSAIVLQGRAQDWRYLLLDEGRVYFRPGKAHLGKSFGEMKDEFRDVWGDEAAVLGVGPAGEAGIRFATVSDGSPERTIRGGLGAVFGAKNLKALVIRPDRPVKTDRPEAFLDAAAPLIRSMSDVENTADVQMGTRSALRRLNHANALPTHNFQTVGFEDRWFDALEGLDAKKKACVGCPLSCVNLYFQDDSGDGNEKLRLPLFPEHLWALGPLLDVTELGDILKALGGCSETGIDPVSMGVVAAWVSECMQKGIDLGVDPGPEAGFGRGQWLASLPAELVSRPELRDLLGMGVFRAAKRIGIEATQSAMHFWGQELSYTDPRRGFLPLSFLGPAVDLSRGDMGVQESLSDQEWVLEMIRRENRWALLESVGVCPWASTAQQDLMENLAKMCRFVAGEAVSPEKLSVWGRKCIELIKSFDWREGWRPFDVTLAEKFFSQDLAGNGETYPALNPKQWNERMALYFASRGWSPEGMPPEAGV